MVEKIRMFNVGDKVAYEVYEFVRTWDDVGKRWWHKLDETATETVYGRVDEVTPLKITVINEQGNKTHWTGEEDPLFETQVRQFSFIRLM